MRDTDPMSTRDLKVSSRLGKVCGTLARGGW